MFRFASGIGIAVATSLVLGIGVAPAAASPIEPSDTGLVVVDGIVDPELQSVATFKAEVTEPGEQGLTKVELEDPAGVSGTAVVALEDDRFDPIAVEAEIDGQVVREEFVVEEFLPVGDEDFVARLRATSSGEILHIDTTAVQQQAIPVMIVLGALARLGLKYAIRWYGKTQVKKSVKSYLLNNISADKWKHIMEPKHLWSAVGARSREEVAELMARAMAEGSHTTYKKSAMKAVWKYKGRTIEVTYAKNSGHVSNGWVVP
ncbi:SAR2788 family putative toxin [Actinoplanes sp. NEAU-A12]|uniref:SAR2788 family putative toxin n=1 Tax=Actinoplanes sandaracinus TaxID=3045177 RepID=A0ABT6WLU6_9ACTN|nr:SAR2788 family putative toxin [Actinoplanes sandaracinus]MDI6100708.1 SAR2788 family putative toxin [Actinoplanes sandaracinus]